MASTLPVALHYARSDALKDSRHSPLPLVRLRPRAAPEMGGHILAQKRGHKVCPPTVGGHGSGLKKETKKWTPKKAAYRIKRGAPRRRLAAAASTARGPAKTQRKLTETPRRPANAYAAAPQLQLTPGNPTTKRNQARHTTTPAQTTHAAAKGNARPG